MRHDARPRRDWNALDRTLTVNEVFSWVCSWVDAIRGRMTNLPNAPLVYTLGVVHFPAVPEMQRFAPAFHDTIRSTYPHINQNQVSMANVELGPQGIQFRQQESQIWQFANPDRTWAMLLTPQVMALHTVAYVDHQDFLRRLHFGLERLFAVPGLDIVFVEAIGIRYVDKVVPRDGERLESYLKPSVLPESFEDVPGLTMAEGIYLSRFLTTVGELRCQVLRNPPTVLPPELESPMIQQNGWSMTRPTSEFAVVDIDHGTKFVPLKLMDAEQVCDHMLELRHVARAMFDNVGTPHGMTVWRGEGA